MAAHTTLESRSFLQRAVRFLAEEARVDQFLDIGAGLPGPGSTHEIAQRRVPHARILYADNDPAVGRRAPALLAGPRPGPTRLGDGPPDSVPTGRVRFIEADLREPASILTHPQLKETLDLGRPVALILIGVLHLIPGQARSREIVRELLAALPSGSYLAATSLTLDFGTADSEPRSTVHPRTRAEFAEFFTGLGLIGPGIVPVSEWLPEVPAHQRPPAEQVATYGALGRKP